MVNLGLLPYSPARSLRTVPAVTVTIQFRGPSDEEVSDRNHRHPRSVERGRLCGQSAVWQGARRRQGLTRKATEKLARAGFFVSAKTLRLGEPFAGAYVFLLLG